MLTTLSGRNPSQDEFELRSFIALLVKHSCKSYLEIGARHGDTFYEVMSALPKGSRGVAVDLPAGRWGTEKSAQHLRMVGARLKRDGYHIRVIFGDSQSAKVIAQVAALGPFDGALIDGDHLYEGVKADWHNYRDMARIVAFHDIAGDGQTTKGEQPLPVEVPKLWHELKATHASAVEFIAPDSKMGIGVVFR